MNNPLSDFDKDQRQMRGAIFTTFPFDADFYENVILSVLSNKNINGKNVVLIDSANYDQTFKTDGIGQVSLAGEDYYLAPISVEGRKVFHPKIYFFGGERRVYAFLGSANLTQKGFLDNSELWTSLSYEKNNRDNNPEHLLLLRNIRDFLSELMDSKFANEIGELPRNTSNEVLESCEWISEVELGKVEKQAYFLHNLDRSIFDQVFSLVKGPIEKIMIIAPYFGKSKQVLERLTSLGDFEVELYLQQNQAQLDSELLQTWIDENDLAKLKVFSNSRFVHGKLLLIKTKEQAFCLTGSPNPSLNGMLKSARNGGNIEAGLIRKGKNPNSFDYLIEDEISSEIIGTSPKKFNPAPEPFFKGTKESVDSEIRLLDAIHKRKLTYAEVHLKIDVSNIDDIDGQVIFQGNQNEFKLPLSELEINPIEDEKDIIEVVFNVSSDTQQSVLSDTCKAWVEVDEVQSNMRWVDHKFIEKEGAVEEGIDNKATSVVPDQIPDFLLSEKKLQAEIMNIVGRIVNGLKNQSDSGGGGGGGRPLPPSQEPPSSSTPGDPEELLTDLYKTWIRQMELLTERMEDTKTDTIVRNFSSFIGAMNRATMHLVIIENYADQLGYEGRINFKYIPWIYFRDLYGGEGSLLDRFISHLFEQKENLKSREDVGVHSVLDKFLLPQILLTLLILLEERDQYRNFNLSSKEEFAPSNSFLKGNKTLNDQKICDVCGEKGTRIFYGEKPEDDIFLCRKCAGILDVRIHVLNSLVRHFSERRQRSSTPLSNHITKEIQDVVDKVINRYAGETKVQSHIKARYRNKDNLNKKISEIYERFL